MRSTGLWKWVVAAVMLAGCRGQGLAADDQAERAKSLLKLTGGAQAKIVWEHRLPSEQDATNKMWYAPDWDGVNGDFELVVFDTVEGKERVLVPGPRNCINPHITADGKTVVFSDLDKVICYAVDWSGQNLREIAKGTNAFVMTTWRDPATGRDWVYLGNCYNPKPTSFYDARGEFDIGIGATYEIVRRPLDKPEVVELVWKRRDAIPISHRFCLSADGTRAGSETPWPYATVLRMDWGINTPPGWFKPPWFANGCWSGLAPDNSYLFHLFRGDHKALRTFKYLEKTDCTGGQESHTVDVSQLPGAQCKAGCWAPKWSSHVRFLTIQELGGNSYLGRFDEKISKVEEWVQVTSDGKERQVTQAYAWIDKPNPVNEKPNPAATTPAVKVRDKSPAAMAALKAKTHVELSGKLVAKTETPTPKFIEPYKRALVVYEYAVDQVTQGQYAKPKIRIARWGIEDRKVTPVAGEAIGTSGKFVLESMAAYPNLESDYLADTLAPNLDLDVYVEVKGAGAPAAAGKTAP